MILASSEVGTPEPKLNTIDVPGGDGVLDYTEYFGEVKFDERVIKLTFLTLEKWEDRFAFDAALKNDLHGRKMHIAFDDDPLYYWVGRISVGSWQYYNGVAKVAITATCEPYKYKAEETVVTQSLSAETATTVTLENSQKRVCPFITSADVLTIILDGQQITHAAGENYQIPELVIPSGGISFDAYSNGSVTFKYREGSL